MKRAGLVLAWVSSVAVLAAIGGCRPDVSHPWAGKPYQSPTGYANPAESTYAPMPSLLPSTSSSDYLANPANDEQVKQFEEIPFGQ